MLAPRRVLWSTPSAAVQRAFEVVPLSESDVVVDIGCGDGRVLLEWAKLCCSVAQSDDEERGEAPDATTTSSTGTPSNRNNGLTFIGIDTDPERIQAAERAWEEAVLAEQIDPGISHRFHCANAVADPALWGSATVLYAYLTPRGMRRMRPLLLPSDDEDRRRCCPNLRRAVSYVNALPGADPLRRERIAVPHQPGAAWPLYVYRFR